MTKPLQIFMEYKVYPNKIHEYEQAMKHIKTVLSEYEATQVEWYIAEDQPFLYVEMCEVPTRSHYHVLKELRKSSNHPVFGKIIPFIEGGAAKIHCWAFQRKEL